jgi:hypothetical protein
VILAMTNKPAIVANGTCRANCIAGPIVANPTLLPALAETMVRSFSSVYGSTREGTSPPCVPQENIARELKKTAAS